MGKRITVVDFGLSLANDNASDRIQAKKKKQNFLRKEGNLQGICRLLRRRRKRGNQNLLLMIGNGI